MANPAKVKAEVIAVDNHYEGIVGYTFKILGRMPRFAPGQFLHLTIDPFDQTTQWPESRVFSIASSPADRDTVKVIISRKGHYTTRIINELRVGSQLWLKLPYGDFTFNTENQHIVLIGGGTGMAPFISFLEECVAENRTNRIAVYYGVRLRDHLVYHRFLEEVCNRLPNMSFHIFVQEHETLDNNYLPGIIDIKKIISDTGNSNADYYLSGPWAMIDNFRKQLLENNIPSSKILIDEWS